MPLSVGRPLQVTGRKIRFMRLQIAKNYLAEGIQIVSKAVPAKTTMPILECILIDASSGADIFLIANDMELGIQTVVPGMILEKGIVAVDARIFSEIIRKLPDGDVFLTSGLKERFSLSEENKNREVTVLE